MIFTVNYLVNLSKQYVTKQINQNELKLHLSNLNEELHENVFELLNLRSQEIAKYLISEFNSKDDQLLMESFDWELNWVLGSSSLATLREQLVTLSLNCRNNVDLKTISFEMDQEKLGKLIEELENAVKSDNDIENK